MTNEVRDDVTSVVRRGRRHNEGWVCSCDESSYDVNPRSIDRLCIFFDNSHGNYLWSYIKSSHGRHRIFLYGTVRGFMQKSSDTDGGLYFQVSRKTADPPRPITT